MNPATVDWKAVSRATLTDIQAEGMALIRLDNAEPEGSGSQYMVFDEKNHRRCPKEGLSQKKIRTALFEMRHAIHQLPASGCVWAYYDVESKTPEFVVGVGWLTNEKPVDESLTILDLDELVEISHGQAQTQAPNA